MNSELANGVVLGLLVSICIGKIVVAENFWKIERLTGNWNGMRTSMEDKGININAENVFEWSTVLDGGIATESSERNLFTLDVEIDLEKTTGISDATVFLQFLSVTRERGGTADSGDIQVYSNIENDRTINVLYEAWYEQYLLNQRLRLKVGKVDANTEFNYVDAAGDFANSSAGFSPTIFVFPTYPDPAMSLNLFATVLTSEAVELTLGYGVYDGAAGVDGVALGSRGPSTFFDDDRSDDYFHIGEGVLSWADGRLAIGNWWHTGDFETFSGNTEDGSQGFYALAEQRVITIDDKDSDAGLYVFAQFGTADDDVSEIGRHIAGGVLARGLVSARPNDAFGLYVTSVKLSDDSAAGFSDDEMIFDLFYKVQITPAIFLQPEFQYVRHPAGDSAIDDAVIGGFRVGASF